MNQNIAKMEQYTVLANMENVMKRLRIYTDRLSDLSDDFFNSIATHFNLVNMIIFIVTSALFVFQSTTQLIDALRTVMVVIGSIQSLGMFITFGMKIVQVKQLHLKLQNIVDQSIKGEYFACKNLIDSQILNKDDV